jgi:molecular chaperone DnaJ
MNEVNEAYDLLQNPEKFKAKQEQEQKKQQQQYRSAYSGFGQNGSQGTNQGYGWYQGAGGWYSDFGGFDFGDIFGFNTRQYDTAPSPQSGDPDELVRAIYSVNNRRYSDAIMILSRMTSTYRNARWYYVSAVAHYGAGDTARAMDLIQKAFQMEPGNPVYKQLMYEYTNQNQTQSSYREIVFSRSPFSFVLKMIFGIMVIRIVLFLIQMLYYSLSFGH